MLNKIKKFIEKIKTIFLRKSSYNNSEIIREHNRINRIEVFKKRTDDFFANYENSSGAEDSLEVCLIRDGCRAVTQAEEIINRQKQEIKNWKAECQAADGYEDALVERTKTEAYKELLNFLECKVVCKEKITAMGYESAIIDIKNFLKETVRNKIV